MKEIHIPENPIKRSQYVQNLFDSIAGTYNLLNSVLSVGIDRYWRKRMIRLAEVPPKGKVLDLCTGTGKVVFDFARYSQAHEIIGLDFSLRMVEYANRELIKNIKISEGWDVRFVQGDALNLPFKDNYFDAVTSAFGLRNVISPEQYFQEKYRVTKPGGKTLTLELTRPHNIFLRGLYYPYLHGYSPLMGRLISGSSNAYSYLAKTITEFHAPENILEYMRKTGWRNIRAIPLTGGITTIYYGMK